MAGDRPRCTAEQGTAALDAKPRRHRLLACVRGAHCRPHLQTVGPGHGRLPSRMSNRERRPEHRPVERTATQEEHTAWQAFLYVCETVGWDNKASGRRKAVKAAAID